MLVSTADPWKAARKIKVAERVRSALAGNKPLQTDETIVVGAKNATRFASALGLSHSPAPTLTELRTFLSSHFSSSVKRVFIWPDLPEDSVVADVFVTGFAEELKTAAAWEHVVFVILPPPYTELRLASFEGFMPCFNKASPKLKNVLWLDFAVCWNGYRFSRALGANELVVDGSSQKGAGAALKFLKRFCSWLIIEQPTSTSAGHDNGSFQRQDPATASLHVIRGCRIAKNPARGAPSRGGGGGFPQRGRGNYPNRGRGNQQNFVKRHRGFDFL
ncbi:hypothetical protein AAVH_13110 [Aphelenchoides avenae]|nr:hypothetical protein AAVH_13107 [Aphelenchus avenae]KAH7719436.1 hypothetical protein AAVH_13110 [Aphelenchus avenae]